jgi:AhpD family alkylhydroperoxidase
MSSILVTRVNHRRVRDAAPGRTGRPSFICRAISSRAFGVGARTPRLLCYPLRKNTMTSVNLGKQHPAVYQSLMKLDAEIRAALETAGVDPLLVELVKIRVSQLNGCAFCLRLHTRDALAKGETTDRLAVVAAWWEAQYFSDQERAALALAEQVTALAVPERRTWDDGSLTDAQVSAISWLATLMNAWNRVAVTSHYPVAP